MGQDALDASAELVGAHVDAGAGAEAPVEAVFEPDIGADGTSDSLQIASVAYQIDVGYLGAAQVVFFIEPSHQPC